MTMPYTRFYQCGPVEYELKEQSATKQMLKNRGVINKKPSSWYYCM